MTDNLKSKQATGRRILKSRGANIYDRLREPKFHLLIFFDGRNDPPDWREELPAYASTVNFHIVPLYPNIAEIFDFAESFTVLLRPAKYIGLIFENLSAGAIRNYLSALFQNN